MATNSIIAVKTSNGDYKSIYVHNDGYPEYMYPMLRDWHNTQEKAEALVNHGDASFIAKRLEPSKNSDHHFDHPEDDVCIFYHRDRGELWRYNAPCLMSKEEVLATQYYAYIFEDGMWRAYAGRKEVDSYEY